MKILLHTKFFYPKFILYENAYICLFDFFNIKILMVETTINVFNAGSLDKLLNDEQRTHTEALNLSGFLNGSDIAIINSLKNLSVLDLSNTKIVEGGNFYYYSSASCCEYYTHNDEIGDYMFAFNNLIKITLPNNIKIIGYRAFYCCPLTHIVIPDSVIGIGKESFKNGKLKTVTIGKKVQWIGDSAFGYCGALPDITIPDNVIYIGNSVFSHCLNLETITLGENIQFIGSAVFRYCEKLSKIHCKKMSSVNNTTFKNLNSSSCKMYISDEKKEIDVLNYIFQEPNKELSINLHYAGTLKHIDIRVEKMKISGCINGDDIIAIRKMINRINGIYYLDLSETQVVKGGKSYYTQIIRDYGRSRSYSYKTDSNQIGDCMFYDCKGLHGITLPKNTLSIGRYAFQNCINISYIAIPENVKSIENNAFFGCCNLQTVIIGNNVEGIWHSSFSSCTKLDQIQIPDSVKDIGNSAFKGCANLKSVVLGKNVQNIGKDAFKDCNNLSKFLQRGMFPSINHMSTIGIDISKCKLYIDNKMENCFLTSNELSINLQINILNAGSLKKHINDVQKRNIQHLKLSGYLNGDDINFIREMVEVYSLVILDLANTQIIGGGRFYTYTEYNCNRQEIWQESDEICDYTFYRCTNLSRIILPNNIERIGNFAFAGCTKLESIENLPERLSDLGDNAFDDCEILEKLLLPRFIGDFNEITRYDFNNTGIKYLSLPQNIGNPYGQHFGVSAMEALISIDFWYDNSCDIYISISDCVSLEEIRVHGDYNMSYIFSISRCPKFRTITYNNCKLRYKWNENSQKSVIELIEHDNYTMIYNWNTGRLLASVTFRNTCKFINREMFNECENEIQNITIPDLITDIKEFFFQNYEFLESVTIGNGIKEIKEYTFYGCDRLKIVKLGNGIKTIGNKAFAHCNKLAQIYCNGLPPQIDETTFQGVDLENCKLHTRSCYINDYKNDKYWKRFIKEEKTVKTEPIIYPVDSCLTSTTMFDDLFKRYQNEFIYQKGRAQYDNLYDKIRASSKLSELCRMSMQYGLAPNAEDFKIAAMVGSTWFGFNQKSTKMGALIALKIWDESTNFNKQLANDITLYNKAQSIIRITS